MTTIGQVTEPVGTWNPLASKPGMTFQYIDLSAIDNERKCISSASSLETDQAPSRARQLVATGDVLVSTVRPNLNAVAVVPPDLNGATASTGFAVLRPGSLVEGRHPFHWVRSARFVREMMRRATGASYPAVSDRIVKESILPLPPLDEQRQIASILDVADELQAKRRTTLTLLDDLAQSIYNELLASSQWNVVRLIDLCRNPDDIRCGPFGTQLAKSEFRDEGVPLWGIKNVNSRFALPPWEYLDPDTAERLAQYAIIPGDIVMTRKGTVGNCAVYPTALEPGVMHSDLLRIRVDTSKVLPILLAHVLQKSNHVATQLGAIASGAVMPGINVTKLKQLTVPIPPMAVQIEGVRRAAAVNAASQGARTQYEGLDTLYASLQQDVFGCQR